MKVIGTAGHVDHGKSALVRVLTGINPDRLREEQEREMTIDLGFAWMELPDGESVGIIDVPGHIDFIDNMLAGVGGIDGALLVIAADEGVMPQTREHLSILDLLDVDLGVVAITKSDLVQDVDWMDLVVEEVRELIQSTSLAGAPIIPVSALDGSGLDSLKHALQQVLAGSQDRLDLSRPRLPIDRSFSISGFGTVVTGTLIDGSFSIGDEIHILPGERTARIRGLQTHQQKIEQARPGSRVAINLAGVEAAQIVRGQVVALPGQYKTTRRIDVSFRLLPDAAQTLVHNQQVKMYHGAAQRSARVRLLGVDKLEPGDSGWLQLELASPIVAARGDKFVLRRPSPGATLGGGQILEPHPTYRYKRNDQTVLTRFESSLAGTPAEQIEAALHGSGPIWQDDLQVKLAFPEAEFLSAIEELERSGRLVMIEPKSSTPNPEGLLVDRGTFSQLQDQILSLLSEYHDRFPLRAGMPMQELRSRLKGDTRVMQAVLERLLLEEVMLLQVERFSLPDFEPLPSPEQQLAINDLLGQFRSNPYNTPSVKQVKESIGEEPLSFLLLTKQLIQLGPDVLLTTDDYSTMESEVRNRLRQQGTMTIADVRDLFNTSRKYALALMEQLDARGVTIREGDTRRLLN